MELPIYELMINEDMQDDAEVSFIALVDKPAIQKNWNAEAYTISYRYKERTSFYVIKEKNVFQIDLTTVRASNIINNIYEINQKSLVEIHSIAGSTKEQMESMDQVAIAVEKIDQIALELLQVVKVGKAK